ncbi:hypothetical protein Nham_3200 [Nitrobacter hamburgensis X14]|uniref:Uncharacterized protein n=1 Tax=Nitrobacter hamburgensis (strain DSM 10229 / NCIMB 13809 / X14) TaxID=323097 RepID=Q1QIL2_NITHX|nr:hypothetical protein Nham_3200 [Nitrobacter hamburgensis X14]
MQHIVRRSCRISITESRTARRCERHPRLTLFAPHHAADDGRSDGRRTDSNDLTVSNEKGRSGDAATRNSSIGWRRHAIVARSCQPNLILLYSVFKRSMSSGLTRGRIPVRVKKTRQNRKLEPALIPLKPE